MNERVHRTRPALWVGLFFVCLASTSVACGGERSCTLDDDCFQGELCITGVCEIPGENNSTSNNATSNNANATTASNSMTQSNSSTNGSTNSSSNNADTNNATNSETNSATNNSTALDCVVDLFGNQCAEDEWEENDGYDASTSNYGDVTPWESNSWCADATTIDMPTRTLSGTLCAADGADAFRLVVANNGPMCLSNNTIFRITVDIKTPCSPSLVTVEPYTFGRDPIRNDLCADDENVRCRSENGGQRRIVEWIMPFQQSYDPRVQIVAARDDVQIEYDLTFEVIPQ